MTASAPPAEPDDREIERLAEHYGLSPGRVREILREQRPRTPEEVDAILRARSEQHTFNPHRKLDQPGTPREEGPGD